MSEGWMPGSMLVPSTVTNEVAPPSCGGARYHQPAPITNRIRMIRASAPRRSRAARPLEAGRADAIRATGQLSVAGLLAVDFITAQRQPSAGSLQAPSP